MSTTVLTTLALLTGAPGSSGSASPGGGAEKVVTLAAVGDVMFGRYLRKATRPHVRYRAFALDRPFRHVKHLIAGHDIAICNLETPISARRYLKPYRSLSFRADPKAAGILKAAGFTVVATANNHSFDQGNRGVAETIRHLTTAGLKQAGMGLTRRQAWSPLIVEKKGVKVGIFSVTDLQNFPAKQRTGFFAFARYRRMIREMPRHIQAWKDQVDFVVVNLHFGSEYYQPVHKHDKRLIYPMWKAGAHLVLGHHPHVLRAMERKKGFVSFYSLGNFLFDYGRARIKNTGVAQIQLIKRGDQKRIGRVRFVPVYQHWDRLPRPATGRLARKIRRRLMRFSRQIDRTVRFRRGAGESLDLLPPR